MHLLLLLAWRTPKPCKKTGFRVTLFSAEVLFQRPFFALGSNWAGETDDLQEGHQNPDLYMNNNSQTFQMPDNQVLRIKLIVVIIQGLGKYMLIN